LAQNARHHLGFLVAAGGAFGSRRHALFKAFQIGQHQFGFDHFGIGQRINLVGNVLDVVVLKAAQDMDDRIHFADIAEELVTKPFALARAFDQSRNVDKAELGCDHLGAFGNGGNFVQTLVGHRDLAHIGLDRAEGIIGGLRGLRFSERVEQGGLADVGQADNPEAKTHGVSLQDEVMWRPP